MTYLLDTNACISYLNRADSPIRKRMQQLSPEIIMICSVVEAELVFGVMNSARSVENLARLRRFLEAFLSLPFDSAAAYEYGRIRSDLAQKGTPIGPYDLQIGAIALSRDLTLVTHNGREFSRISGLRVEDWEADGPCPFGNSACA